MKSHSNVFGGQFFLFILFAFGSGCSDLPESNMVAPGSQLQADVTGSDAFIRADIDNDDPTIAELPESQLRLNVQIATSPCHSVPGNRLYALHPLNPKSAITHYYDDPRYQVRWYTFDGTTISKSYLLECLAAGIYYVEVIDRLTSAIGRSKIVL